MGCGIAAIRGVKYESDAKVRAKLTSRQFRVGRSLVRPPRNVREAIQSRKNVAYN